MFVLLVVTVVVVSDLPGFSGLVVGCSGVPGCSGITRLLRSARLLGYQGSIKGYRVGGKSILGVGDGHLEAVGLQCSDRLGVKGSSKFPAF